MMDFDALKVFVTVVEQGGFHAAAGHLFKSQPAISSSIKKLEEQLGISLFNRRDYRPGLSEQGEKLYQRAKVLMVHWRHMNQFSDLLQANMESDITIAIDVFYPLVKLKGLFSQWMSSYPQTHFHFLSESLGGACERLVHGHADIVISENLIHQHAIEVIPLHSESLQAVASPDFIAEHQEQLFHMDALRECLQVILKDSSKTDFSFGVVAHCRHWTVSDVVSKKDIIVAGLGWGRLPRHLIETELADGRLQLLQGYHFDERQVGLSAIRLQKPSHGPIAARLWDDLLGLKRCSRD